MERVAFVCALVACSPKVVLEVPGPAVAPEPAVVVADAPSSTREIYPDAHALFDGAQGIHRSCSTNRGVCHNDKEYPDLSSFGAFTRTIAAPCNTNRAPDRVHDLCEAPGDVMNVRGHRVEIGSLVLLDGGVENPVRPRPAVEVTLREDVAKPGKVLELERRWENGFTPIGYLLRRGPRPDLRKVGAIVPDHRDAKRLKIRYVRLNPENGGLAEYRAGPVRTGDPNRNGVFGADIGGRLVVPGDPGRSYLMRRLVDPAAGPLMPRGNCCAWSKQTLRAMFCWIAGLDADGSNALEPIDYDACPAGPDENVIYPELGPGCETSGMCPVSARVDVAQGSSWTAVYEVLAGSCGDGDCHGGSDASGLDVLTAEAARKSLAPLLIAGKPETSELYRRITPELCPPERCDAMPRGGDPLPIEARTLIRTWIENGAAMPAGSPGAP